METRQFKLRWHHLDNLIKGYSTNYQDLAEGLLGKFKIVLVNGVGRAEYTEEDAIFSRNFYTAISSNPDNNILIVDGVDERCESCGNYRQDKCVLFTPAQLELQDERSRKIVMNYLKKKDNPSAGDTFKVSDLIPLR